MMHMNSDVKIRKQKRIYSYLERKSIAFVNNIKQISIEVFPKSCLSFCNLCIMVRLLQLAI